MDIRPVNYTLRDAQGIIDVDRATFDDCRYAPEYIIELASAGQHIWVADDGRSIVGFVSAFTTHSLAGSRWEIDELAVHPSAQGCGIGTALVAAAIECAPVSVPAPMTAHVPVVSARAPVVSARAIIAHNNIASQRAFVKNGFAPTGDAHLLVWSTSRPIPDSEKEAISVRHAHATDALVPSHLLHETPNVYLIGERDGVGQGHVELVRVCTLQYEGYWIESLAAQELQVARALLCAAITLARQDGKIDLLGCLAPAQFIAHEACTDLGFEAVNLYTIWGRTP